MKKFIKLSEEAMMLTNGGGCTRPAPPPPQPHVRVVACLGNPIATGAAAALVALSWCSW